MVIITIIVTVIIIEYYTLILKRNIGQNRTKIKK